MVEFSRKSTEWGLAVAYAVIGAFVHFMDWLGGRPKASLQDVIEGSTFFVLLGIGGLLWAIYDLCDRVGPPRE